MNLQKLSLMNLQGAADEGVGVEATGASVAALTAWRNFPIQAVWEDLRGVKFIRVKIRSRLTSPSLLNHHQCQTCLTN